MVSAPCWQKTSNEDEGWSHSQVPCGTRLLGTGEGEREHQETNVSEAEDKRNIS